MVRVGLSILIAGMLIILTGCCAIFNGKTQTVTINSAPQGAAVYNTAGQFLGYTPLTLPLDRQREQSLELHLAGYQSQVKYFERRIDWWLFPLDFIIWPTVFVDAESGAMYVFKDPNSTVLLKPISQRQPQAVVIPAQVVTPPATIPVKTVPLHPASDINNE